MKKIVFVALILFSVIGCQSDDNTPSVPGNNTPMPIAFTDITKGALTGDPVAAGNFVFLNQETWNTFKEQTGVGGNALVDFSMHEVIAVVDEVHQSSGYSIEITSITKLDNKLTVQLKKTVADGSVPAPDTQPLHVVRINKMGLPIVFKVNAPM